MSTQPVLVLAGGTYQLPLIHALRRRSLPVILFDGDSDAPGFAHAPGEVVDIGDPAAVVEAARRIAPRAVASIVSEVSVRSAAAVAEALGLPGIGTEPAENSTDKHRMRSCFERAGLATPRFEALTRLADAPSAAERIGYPVVVKPVDSSGSRGVLKVDAPQALVAAVQDAFAHSRTRTAIIEAFLEGTEYTVETVTVGGRTEILGISDKTRLPFPHCVSISLTYPPALDDTGTAAVAEAARGAIRAVGLRDAPGHIEVMLTRDGPVVVELAARGGGFRIFSDILPMISGVDPVETVIDLALGSTPRIVRTRDRAAVLRFFNPPQRGVLGEVRGVEAAREIPGVFDLVIEAPTGKPFRGITRDGERPGYVITVADDRQAAVAAADAAERAVEFVVEADGAAPVHDAPPAGGGKAA